VSPPPVVLDPYSDVPLSSRDRAAAARGGVLVVDCSWNLLSQRGSFPRARRDSTHLGRYRRLPVLVATNPQHYGRLAQLNTVEAFTAALYLLGRPEQAEQVVAGFHGGKDFLSVNRARLDEYQRAESPEAVREAEKSLFGSA